jgi:hypothetical protein
VVVACVVIDNRTGIVRTLLVDDNVRSIWMDALQIEQKRTTSRKSIILRKAENEGRLISSAINQTLNLNIPNLGVRPSRPTLRNSALMCAPVRQHTDAAFTEAEAAARCTGWRASCASRSQPPPLSDRLAKFIRGTSACVRVHVCVCVRTAISDQWLELLTSRVRIKAFFIIHLQQPAIRDDEWPSKDKGTLSKAKRNRLPHILALLLIHELIGTPAAALRQSVCV